ncbi:hypothetical protein GGI12_002021 [Dipsacomyces acuminosporus]|nr:hypothetical protein GGI12_002021 [Dipsacomyces acuminosporus]
MVKLTLALGLLAASLAATALAYRSDVEIFTPELKDSVKFNVYDEPDNTVSDKASIATAYLNQSHKIPLGNIKITDAYTSMQSGITHVYVRQVIGGVEVSNAVGNVNINRQGKVVSSSHSFASANAVEKIKRSKPTLSTRADDTMSIRKALGSLASYVKTDISAADIDKVTVSSPSSFSSGESERHLGNIPSHAAVTGSATAKRTYIQTANGSLVPTWNIVLNQGTNWWNAHIDTDTNKVASINNWVSSSESYSVFPRTVNDPIEGKRQLVSDPASTSASPKGWVSSGTTVGNNVWAQNNPTGGDAWKNNYRPKAASGNRFDYPLDFSKAPPSYVDAAITQLFYTVNTMHDLSYIYGFDEAAGNFQDVNYSGRGLGNDAVVAFAQDGSGTDNANFATPPDGQNGVMRMYVFTETNPNRDGDFEQDIVAHEFTHGISNRLTGGPSNTDCLNTLEAGGMGEGWSDTVANILRIRSTDTRAKNIILGEYVVGRGIRNYPYSTSTAINPSTYAYLNKSTYREVHAVGEVWAEILYEVVWNLIDAHGIAADLFSHDLSKGNSLALQILLDGMKLQPCNPTFVTARDAIIQADQNLTGGKNKCAIWKGFSKRGLGPRASGTSGGTNHVEDSTAPAGC